MRPHCKVIAAGSCTTSVALSEVIEGDVVEEGFAVENWLFAHHIESCTEFHWQSLSVC